MGETEHAAIMCNNMAPLHMLARPGGCLAFTMVQCL